MWGTFELLELKAQGTIVEELPVSKMKVAVRQPNGADDLVLLERAGRGKRAALALIARLTLLPEGASFDWSNLPVTDFQTLLLLLHRAAFGEEIRSQTVCMGEGCRARVEIWFRISDFFVHHAPHQPAGVEPDKEQGWFLIREFGVRFRLPTVADLLAASEEISIALPSKKNPFMNLVRRLIRPLDPAPKALRRIEAAMSALAPGLSSNLEGTCPECQRKVLVYFDVEQFVLKEFLDQAAFIYQDIHLLASRYRWAEEAILDLPRNRRIAYAEMLKQEGGLA